MICPDPTLSMLFVFAIGLLAGIRIGYELRRGSPGERLEQ